MIGFCPLASGSRGNSIFIGSSKAKILVDAGLSVRALETRLSEIGVSLSDINAVLITHEHADHIAALQVLVKKYDIPLFANRFTAEAIALQIKREARFKIFSTGESFIFEDMEIHPFSVQHDAADPVMFTFRLEGHKLGVCTDLGFATSLVRSQLQDCDYLVVEANHQPSMVHASSRSSFYKERVLGRVGHLSNEQCAELLLDVYHPHLKHAHLAHLSSECNSEELALKIVRQALSLHGKEMEVSIAYQDKVSMPIHFSKVGVSL